MVLQSLYYLRLAFFCKITSWHWWYLFSEYQTNGLWLGHHCEVNMISYKAKLISGSSWPDLFSLWEAERHLAYLAHWVEYSHCHGLWDWPTGQGTDSEWTLHTTFGVSRDHFLLDTMVLLPGIQEATGKGLIRTQDIWFSLRTPQPP